MESCHSVDRFTQFASASGRMFICRLEASLARYGGKVGEAHLDRFSFFFSFYGLILGLAVAELLSGFAGMVRAHALKKLEAQTALTALLTLTAIVATWVDAFSMERSLTLDFRDLWAPIVLAIIYYLAAAVIFPRDVRQYAHLRASRGPPEVRDRAAVRRRTGRSLCEPRLLHGHLHPRSGRVLGLAASLQRRDKRRDAGTAPSARRPSHDRAAGPEVLILLVPYWDLRFASGLTKHLFGY